MSDAIQVAEQRRKEYKMAISKKENEIVELKERIEDLDNFIEFGQALVGKDDDKPRTVSRTPQPTQASEDKSNNDDGDDWGKSDDAAASAQQSSSGIARVLSQRAG